MSMVDSETVEGYKPSLDFVEDCKDSLIDLNSIQSKELFLLNLPFSNDLLSDIDGQELSLNLHSDGNLGSFEGSTGKVYDFVSFAGLEPDETVFVDSSTEPKIAAKISRRVSIIHYPDPKELEILNSSKKTQTHRNSTGATVTTSSRYFPMQSSGRSSGRAASSKGSRQKSSLSEVGEDLSIKSKSIKSGDLSYEEMDLSSHMVIALAFPLCPLIILMEENQREENMSNAVFLHSLLAIYLGYYLNFAFPRAFEM